MGCLQPAGMPGRETPRALLTPPRRDVEIWFAGPDKKHEDSFGGHGRPLADRRTSGTNSVHVPPYSAEKHVACALFQQAGSATSRHLRGV